MKEYSHDGHELLSYYADLLCSSIKYGLASVTLLHFSDEKDCVPPRWFILQKPYRLAFVGRARKGQWLQ